MFFRSIISLLFFFLFLLLVSFVYSPLIVLEIFYYFVSHLVSGWQNIKKSINISTLLANFTPSSLREDLATWRDLSILKPGMVMIPQHKLIIVSWSTLMTLYRIGQVRPAKYRSHKHLETIGIAQTIRGNWLYFHNWTILYVFVHYGAAACLCPTKTYF